MRNIILSIVVLSTLVVAGVGGTLADFSDIEISEDNYFSTGALDLVVSNKNGVEYPADAPTFYMVSDALPGCDKSVFLDLHNYGQGFQADPYLYLHIKNVECGWVMPKKPFAWLDANCNKVDPPDPLPDIGDFGTGYPRPVTEPEFVAECGGIAGELVDGTAVTVAGMGEYGENCKLSRHIKVQFIEIAGPYPHDEAPMKAEDVPEDDWTRIALAVYDDDPQDDKVMLNELECHEIPLGQLKACNKIWLHMSLVLLDYDEEDAETDGVINETYFGETYPEAKWDHWPSNAYQKDYVEFDMAFELLQTEVP